MPNNLTADPACYPLNVFFFVTGVFEQQATETIVHNVITIHWQRHGDTIFMSENTW